MSIFNLFSLFCCKKTLKKYKELLLQIFQFVNWSNKKSLQKQRIDDCGVSSFWSKCALFQSPSQTKCSNAQILVTLCIWQSFLQKSEALEFLTNKTKSVNKNKVLMIVMCPHFDRNVQFFRRIDPKCPNPRHALHLTELSTEIRRIRGAPRIKRKVSRTCNKNIVINVPLQWMRF